MDDELRSAVGSVAELAGLVSRSSKVWEELTLRASSQRWRERESELERRGDGGGLPPRG
jgi:hypothetical protein